VQTKQYVTGGPALPNGSEGKNNKKTVLSQGNRAMPQQFFSV